MNPPIDLVPIDPGETSGWAWFHQRVLVKCGYGSFADVIKQVPRETWAPGTQALVELPQWRPNDRNIDINDIIGLAVMAGEFKRAFEERGIQVKLVWPRTWKGTVPKQVMTHRILNKLHESERVVVPSRPRAKTPDHNCVDAIGLGLWELGRLHG